MWHQVMLIGNLGKDPEMKYLSSGNAVTNFSVATSKKWSRDGESHEETIWWRVAAFGKLGEICNQYLAKGSRVLVIGEMKGDKNGNPKTFQKSDGSTGSSFEITASEVKFLSPKGEVTARADVVDSSEDIPF